MSLIVKIMSAENLADDNTQKSHRLLTGVKFVEFDRSKGAPIARIVFVDEPESGEFDLDGNVYVMNESGRTVSSFGVAPPDLPPRVSYTQMSPGDMLQAIGDNAQKWADAFAEQYPDIDQGMMIAWFANAIENTWDTRCSRFTRDDQAWADFKDQVERHRKFWRELAAMPDAGAG